ncbi:MAG: GNAT family N-acetyltransferase [Sphingobium sp.]
MTEILPLHTQDESAVDALLDAAFGADRRGRTAYMIRHGMPWLPELSYAAQDPDGALAGTLQSWPIALHGSNGTMMPLVMVGPVAVRPDHQKGGIGRRMMDAVVRDARALGSAPLMMIGDPEYYGRFWGFSADGTAGWNAPGPFERHRLLALAIGNDALPTSGMLGPRLSAAA